MPFSERKVAPYAREYLCDLCNCSTVYTGRQVISDTIKYVHVCDNGDCKKEFELLFISLKEGFRLGK